MKRLVPALYCLATLCCCVNGLIERLYCGKENCYEGNKSLKLVCLWIAAVPVIVSVHMLCKLRMLVYDVE